MLYLAENANNQCSNETVGRDNLILNVAIQDNNFQPEYSYRNSSEENGINDRQFRTFCENTYTTKKC